MANSLFILSMMPNDLAASWLFEAAFVKNLVEFAATYWLHSTLFPGAAYPLTWSAKPNSHFIRERIWKLSATAGFATAVVQLATGLGFPLLAAPGPVIATGSFDKKPVADTVEPGLAADQANQDLTNSLKRVQNSLSTLGEELPRTLTESKLPQKKVAATSPESTIQNPDLQLTVTFLPPEGAASPIAASMNPDVSLGATKHTNTTVFFAEATADFEERAASGATSRLQTLMSWTLIGWFLSSLLYVAWLSLRFRWQMRHVSPAAPSHRRLLESICQSRGVKRSIRLLKSNDFEEPVAYGLFRPTILIPNHVEKRLNRDELAALLSHEPAQRRDPPAHRSTPARPARMIQSAAIPCEASGLGNACPLKTPDRTPAAIESIRRVHVYVGTAEVAKLPATLLPHWEFGCVSAIPGAILRRYSTIRKDKDRHRIM